MMYRLDNGLRVVLHPVKDSHMAVINLMYGVGSRNEHCEKTGLAHFLEHVAFGGSLHVADYDKTLQGVGGKNNAYTSSDVTNYWCQLPVNQLEVGLYLESDRLLGLAYKEEVVDVQRSVVVEEFKQTCLNKPYGDVWHLLCEESYAVHPYRWPTIGKEVSHIEGMMREDLVGFGRRFYVPANAVLVVVGGFELDKVDAMVRKWFGGIPSSLASGYALPQENSLHSTFRHVVRDVPQNALYKTFHIPGRGDKDYGALDLLTSYFDEGRTSLFYKELVEELGLVSSIDVYLTETFDPGLLVIEAKLQEGVTFKVAEEALQELIDRTVEQGLPEEALQRVKNQRYAHHAFSQVGFGQRAEGLAYAVMLGDEHFFEEEIAGIGRLTRCDVQEVAAKVFTGEGVHTVYYEKK